MMQIDISLKDIVWRLDNPDEIPDHIDSLSLMWIDEYISVWKDFLNKEFNETVDNNGA